MSDEVAKCGSFVQLCCVLRAEYAIFDCLLVIVNPSLKLCDLFEQRNQCASNEPLEFNMDHIVYLVYPSLSLSLLLFQWALSQNVY